MQTLTKKSLPELRADLDQLKCMTSLSSEARDLLASIAVKRKLSANDFLWKMGDSGEFAGIVASGLIEITRYSPTGDRELAMGIFGPSDAVGLSAVVQNIPYPGSARAVAKNTEIIKLYLRPVIQSNSPLTVEIQAWIREMFLLHEQALRDKIDILNAGAVENRVFELISHLIRRFGRNEAPLRYFVPIRLTRAQAAKLTDVRIETIIRLTSRWRKQRLLSWTPDGILIENLPVLEKSLFRSKGLN